MKRIKFVAVGAVLSIAAALGLVSSTQAIWSDDIQSGNTIAVEANTIHQGSLYASGGQIDISGTVTGDVYCFGGDVVISGTVEGDVLCAAQSIRISGTVGQDVRIASQYAQLDNTTIGGSVSLLVQDARLNGNTTVGGDLNGAAQRVESAAAIDGNIRLAVQMLAIKGKVAGNVDAILDLLTLADDARIAGNLTYLSEREQQVDQAAVAGEISHQQPNSRTQQTTSYYGMWLMFLLSLLLTAFVVALLAPRFVERSSQVIRRAPLNTVLLGFAVLFGAPIIAVMLMVTIVLLPLGLIVLALWLVALVLSGVFSAYFVGSVLLRGQLNILVRMLGGAAVILVLYSIPFLNGLAMVAAGVLGAGAFVATLTDGYKRPSYKVAPPKKSAKSSGGK